MEKEKELPLEERIKIIVNDSINACLEPAIEKEMESMVKASVAAQFDHGSVLRKKLDEKLSEAIIPLVEGYNFDKYLPKLELMLTDVLNQSIAADNKRLLENFRMLISKGEADECPKNITELFHAYQAFAESYLNETDTSDITALNVYMEVYADRDAYDIEEALAEDDVTLTFRFYCHNNFDDNEVEELDRSLKVWKLKSTYFIMGSPDSLNIAELKHMESFDVMLAKLKLSTKCIEIDDKDIRLNDPVEVYIEKDNDR